MKFKVPFLLSVCIVVLSIIYIFNLINQDFVLNKEDEYEDTMNIWLTTPGLISSVERFQEESGIKMNITKFKSEEALVEELILPNMEDNLPDLIEIHSSYGLDEIMELSNPNSIQKIGEDFSVAFHEATLENFSYDNGLYGYPLGIEIPIIIINRTILDNHIEDNQRVSPFNSSDTLAVYKEIQDKINNNKAKTFWFFHFDEDIPYYWDAFQQKEQGSKTSFEKLWTNLIKEYELVPPLDNHMAVTKFSNMEVGALITTSSNLQMIQELVRSTFEVEVLPLFDSGEPLFVSGSGFISFSNEKKVEMFYSFLDQDDVQLEFLSNTGWIPAKNSLIESKPFILQLPMAKYLGNLVKYHDVFSGKELSGNSWETWENIKEEAIGIEMSIE